VSDFSDTHRIYARAASLAALLAMATNLIQPAAGAFNAIIICLPEEDSEVTDALGLEANQLQETLRPTPRFVSYNTQATGPTGVGGHHGSFDFALSGLGNVGALDAGGFGGGGIGAGGSRGGSRGTSSASGGNNSGTDGNTGGTNTGGGDGSNSNPGGTDTGNNGGGDGNGSSDGGGSATVPEPLSMLIWGLGLAGAACAPLARRRKPRAS
jgi:hypothetical protein